MSSEQAHRTVTLFPELYARIEERVKSTGFSSVDEYVAFVLEEVLRDDEEEHSAAFSEEEEEEVKARLRSLGYLD